MKKRIIFLSAVFIFGAGLHQAKTQTNNSLPLVEAPVHPDWFEVKYDDVRESTIIRTKDYFGPGNGLTGFDNNEVFKVSFSATVPGRSFNPNTPIVVSVAFNRMAGLKRNMSSQSLILGGHDADWQAMNGRQVFTLNNCKEVMLVLPTGVRLTFKEPSLSYKTSNSTGLLNENYQWETLVVSGDLNLLNQLQNGAKAAICDTSTAFVKDTISQARSLLYVLKEMGGNPVPVPAQTNAAAPSNNPVPAEVPSSRFVPTASSGEENPFFLRAMAGAFLPLPQAGYEGFQISGGAAVVLGKAITKNFSLGLKGGFSGWGNAWQPGLQFAQTYFGVLTQIYVTDNPVRPYFLLGAGVANESSQAGNRESYFELDPGLGLSFGQEKVSFFAEIQPGFIFGFNNLIFLNGGVNFNLN